MFVTFWNPEYKGETHFSGDDDLPGKITVNLHEIVWIDWRREKTEGYISLHLTGERLVRVFGQQNFDKFDGLVREYAPHVSVSGTVHER